MKLVALWDSDLKKAYALQGTFAENENGFINEAYGMTFAQYQEYVQMCQKRSQGKDLPEGYVPDTIYVLEVQDQYVGIFKFRHYLNDALKQYAGHIGFGIGLPYRKQGYAQKGLHLLIDLVKERILEDEIYMSVNKQNLASLRVQQHCGAYIHHEDENYYYTRIKK